MDQFISQLLQKAKAAGIEPAEVYYVSGESFRAMCQQGMINNYTVNASRGLSLRGIYGGKMGYASTQAFDEDASSQLISGVIESAELTEDESVQEIYAGDGNYPVIETFAPELESVTAEEKLNYIRRAEEALLKCDKRVVATTYNMISTSSSCVRLVNSLGLDLTARDNFIFTYLSALAKDGDKTASGAKLIAGRRFDAENAELSAKKASEEALFMLNAEPVQSGSYRAIFDPYAMSDMLSVFSAIFSAENTQQNMSLLGGREGEKVASDVVSIIDDPLLPGGFDSRAFDDEGVASRTKSVVECGVLKTLLHNLKTARKAGVESTGNARRGGYSAPVRVAPSNFFIKPGEKTLEELMGGMGDGIVITSVSGLHAGANFMSGDFSLIAEGYLVKDGRKAQAVDRITVAGNFYDLLKSIRAVGCDLTFPDSSIGSPSVDVGEIQISGK